MATDPRYCGEQRNHGPHLYNGVECPGCEASPAHPVEPEPTLVDGKPICPHCGWGGDHIGLVNPAGSLWYCGDCKRDFRVDESWRPQVAQAVESERTLRQKALEALQAEGDRADAAEEDLRLQREQNAKQEREYHAGRRLLMRERDEAVKFLNAPQKAAWWKRCAALSDSGPRECPACTPDGQCVGDYTCQGSNIEANPREPLGGPLCPEEPEE